MNSEVSLVLAGLVTAAIVNCKSVFSAYSVPLVIVNTAVIVVVPVHATDTPAVKELHVLPVGVISVGKVKISLSVDNSGMGEFKVMV